MCGITGILSGHSLVEPEVLKNLTAALRHRGPDGEGLWISPERRVGLGHRRLAIVDLGPSGRQPMVSASGRFVTSFNGEIYNYSDLRHELERKGHRFAGHSDTEVLLAACEEWGVIGAVPRFNGMFAAAIWDTLHQQLHLFRDRLGVKPLHYLWRNRTLYFSSELSLPFASLSDRRVNRDALARFFRYNFVPTPQTIYDDVYKLKPGIIATATPYDAERSSFGSTVEYWNTRKRIATILAAHEKPSLSPNTRDAALESLDSAMTQSIRQRMVADVPVGLFLSGGIDSSLIASYLAELSPRPIKTFTVGFDDPAFDETANAREISRFLETEHTEFTITEKDAFDVIPALPSVYGEPFADCSQIPTYLLSRLTRENVTVALSGDGGDELFAGYPYYQRIASLQKHSGLLSPSRAVAIANIFAVPSIGKPIKTVLGHRNWCRLNSALRILSGEREKELPKALMSHISRPEELVLGSSPQASLRLLDRVNGEFVEQLMCDNLVNYLPDDILTKVDRASMANGIEVRAPFADDFALFETAWAMPLSFKHSLRQGGKLILKDLLARRLPRHLFERPKRGFEIPLTRWLNGPLRPWMEECTSAARLIRDGYLDPKIVTSIRRYSAAGSDDCSYTLWAICHFQTWLEANQRDE